LIGSIGIVSAALQGGYVRRALTRVGELKMARRGTTSCALGLVMLALVPQFAISQPHLAIWLLQAAAVSVAFTSATVVNALTAHASLQCDDAPEVVLVVGVDGKVSRTIIRRPELAKGQALGSFRSSGQLGRAIGPLLGERAYYLSDRSMLILGASLRILLDLWAIYHLCNQRCRYDWALSPHA
jgi:hypothetical protein